MSDRLAALLYFALAVALLAVMAIQVKRDDGRTALGSAVRSATGPVVESVSGAAGQARGVWGNYVDLMQARRERDALLQRVELLESERRRFQETFRENQRLRELLDLKESGVLVGGQVARVLADTSTGPLRRTLLVGRGTRDGVVPGWIAIHRGALVGRVIGATDHAAQVLSILDPDSGVAVRHQGDRFAGVMRGGNRGPSPFARLEYVPKDSQIALGDALVTSGLDGVFPAGLLVGTVRELAGGSSLTWDATVEVSTDPLSVEEVLLVPRPSAVTP